MQRKLETSKYKSYQHFAKDFQLVCTNCMKFNGPSTPFYKFSKQMLDVGSRAIVASADRTKQYEVRLKQDKKIYMKKQKKIVALNKIEMKKKLKNDKRLLKLRLKREKLKKKLKKKLKTCQS